MATQNKIMAAEEKPSKTKKFGQKIWPWQMRNQRRECISKFLSLVYIGTSSTD